MLIMGNMQKARGCFTEMHGPKDSGSPDYTIGYGAYVSFSSVNIPETHGKDPYFVSNISMTQAERYQTIPCFGGKNYVYGFGNDPGSVLQVELTVFLVDGDGTGFGTGLQHLLDTYRNTRLSGPEGVEGARVSIGSTFIHGYVVGMRAQTLSAEYNVQTVSFECITPEVS